MIDTGTLCLMSIASIFYLVLPIWGGVRASRTGRPGWAAVSILSIFIGLGPIGGLLALTACKEPAVKVTPKTLEIDGVGYFIEQILFKASIGGHKSGRYVVVLFDAVNISKEERIVATENWRLQTDETEYAPAWSLSTAAEQEFPGRTYHASLDPGKKQVMLAVFELPEDIYADVLHNSIGLFISIPNNKDGVDERIEMKL